MRQIELIRVGLVLIAVTLFMMLGSCSVVRETKKNVWTVDFKSPVKINKVDKCK